MKVDGAYHISAAPERVWEILMDPAFLKLAIPGCEEMVAEGNNSYRVVIKAGVAAIKSTFNGQVRLEAMRPPDHYRMVTTAKGSVGFVNGTGDIDLTPKNGGTDVRYAGDVQVGGLLASVGGRMIEAAFRKSVNDFFAAVAQRAQS